MHYETCTVHCKACRCEHEGCHVGCINRNVQYASEVINRTHLWKALSVFGLPRCLLQPPSAKLSQKWQTSGNRHALLHEGLTNVGTVPRQVTVLPRGSRCRSCFIIVQQMWERFQDKLLSYLEAPGADVVLSSPDSPCRLTNGVILASILKCLQGRSHQAMYAMRNVAEVTCKKGHGSRGMSLPACWGGPCSVPVLGIEALEWAPALQGSGLSAHC